MNILTSSIVVSAKFLWNYKLFSTALIAAAVSLILQSAGLPRVTNLLLLIIAVSAALPLAWDMIQDVRSGRYGIDILALTAIISSLAVKEYWTAVVIVLMLTGGEALEDYAERRSKRELDALLQRAPALAHIIRGRKTIDIEASEVRSGDRIIIKSGETVPVDAVIYEGTATFDESNLTGESVPVVKSPGDQILSGSVNTDGVVNAKAVRTAANSQYQQIIKLVRAAQSSQAPFVRLADRYSIPFTVIAFAIAGSVWFISGDPIRFLQVIVVATPCPLLLAAPIAIISGMSRASKQGIIVRTGSALEKLASVATIAFDKTGTLTTGVLKVDTITTFSDHSKSEVLGYAAALESGSSHILARAVHEAASKLGTKIPKAHNINELSGLGLSATTAGKHVLVGRKSLLDDNGVEWPSGFRISSVKQTAMYVAVDGIVAGYLTFSDEIRQETKTTLERLKRLGIRQFEMITGDNKSVAASVASELHIDQVVSEALPADKMLAIEAIKGRPVAFVGDGVNDAPVLTAADVGIALGARGSTAASESADIIIMVDDISRVADAVSISRRTFKIARQSILIGIGMSIVLMTIFATGRFPPIYGALVQELVDVVVIFNALRAHTPARGEIKL